MSYYTAAKPPRKAITLALIHDMFVFWLHEKLTGHPVEILTNWKPVKPICRTCQEKKSPVKGGGEE